MCVTIVVCVRACVCLRLCICACVRPCLCCIDAVAFHYGWGARGIVAGNLLGKLCHALSMLVLVARTDWNAQVRDAAKRLQGEAAHSSGGVGGGGCGSGVAGGGVASRSLPHVAAVGVEDDGIPAEDSGGANVDTDVQEEQTRMTAAAAGPSTKAPALVVAACESVPRHAPLLKAARPRRYEQLGDDP